MFDQLLRPFPVPEQPQRPVTPRATLTRTVPADDETATAAGGAADQPQPLTASTPGRAEAHDDISDACSTACVIPSVRGPFGRLARICRQSCFPRALTTGWSGTGRVIAAGR
jgi:hypothetical protein